MMISRFHNIHLNETCLIVCNGISLNDVPLEFLQRYVSFGCNTIFKHEDFTPSYYVTVDDRNRIFHRDGIMARLGQVPKFMPTPNMDRFEGENIFRFQHHPAPFWDVSPLEWSPSQFDGEGIFYSNSPQVMMQLAFFMGFRRMLVVGMDHRPYAEGYFWGVDGPILPGRNDEARFRVWEKGYRAIVAGFGKAGAEIWNLTPNSLAEAIPHAPLSAELTSPQIPLRPLTGTFGGYLGGEDRNDEDHVIFKPEARRLR